MSSSDVSALKPSFIATPNVEEPEAIQELITQLNLQPHIEGGYFVETDRALETIPSPFPIKESNTLDLAPQRPGFNPLIRNTSTTIFYLLTPSGPQGGFHRNAGRTVHTLHRGRGQYVLIHADKPGSPIETFTVGPNISKGEKLQWIVEGGKYKASFLLPDSDSQDGDEIGSEIGESNGLLISETVVPGFEFCDHDFLSDEALLDLVGGEKAEELAWLLSPLGKTH